MRVKLTKTSIETASRFADLSIVGRLSQELAAMAFSQWMYGGSKEWAIAGWYGARAGYELGFAGLNVSPIAFLEKRESYLLPHRYDDWVYVPCIVEMTSEGALVEMVGWIHSNTFSGLEVDAGLLQRLPPFRYQWGVS